MIFSCIMLTMDGLKFYLMVLERTQVLQQGEIIQEQGTIILDSL